MAMYTLNLSIALELACEEPEYEDVASKFWEHFVHIARAMNTMGVKGLDRVGELFEKLEGGARDAIKVFCEVAAS
jgi:hypothetical protein